MHEDPAFVPCFETELEAPPALEFRNVEIPLFHLVLVRMAFHTEEGLALYSLSITNGSFFIFLIFKIPKLFE